MSPRPRFFSHGEAHYGSLEPDELTSLYNWLTLWLFVFVFVLGGVCGYLVKWIW